MSKNVVFEGWLTKSPPSRRIWKTKWRKRWFALRQSGELPGQYFLDYYADWNCRRLKGSINLDFCEQVDAGLHLKRSSHGSLPKLRRSVFTIQTQTRTYHLEADCEAEMVKWVDAICKVCGLRSTDEDSDGAYQNSDIAMRALNPNLTNAVINRQPNINSVHTQSSTAPRNNILNNNSVRNNEIRIEISNEYNEDSVESYIPISECVTGVRASGGRRAFTFDPQNIVISTKIPRMYLSHPQIKINNIEFSENESNLSDDECSSMNASQCNMGPPVPPRPPKTLPKFREFKYRDPLQGHRFLNMNEFQDTASALPFTRTPRGPSYNTAPSCSGRSEISIISDRLDDGEENATSYSMQYCNITQPPLVDRALKPRYSSHSASRASNASGQSVKSESKSDTLQYLDLDLPVCNSDISKYREGASSSAPAIHGKSLSSSESRSAYKTVDFLKTEAFNMTRQDAEASRSTQQ